MKTLGLTGSIGMGKSTTAELFREAGAHVYDADAAVHRLYEKGGAAAPVIAAVFPGAVRDGVVDRVELSRQVMATDNGLKRLESIVHPLLAADRAAAYAAAESAHAEVFVLDVPLLYETGGETGVDAVAVVTCPPEIQRDRVLARPGMTVDKLEAILSRQLPDAAKRERADFVIDTSQGLDPVRREVRRILGALGAQSGRLDPEGDALHDS